MMPDEAGYTPCANCGDEWSETLNNSGQPLCEECYNTWRCGCGTGCESCTDSDAPTYTCAGCGLVERYELGVLVDSELVCRVCSKKGVNA